MFDRRLLASSAFFLIDFQNNNINLNKNKMQTTILIGLFICHTLADYTHLSTPEMLSAKRLGKPLFPIFLHAGIHASLMFWFLVFILGWHSNAWILTLVQLFSHFLIDTWKGRMNGWFPALQNPANKWHWIVFGTDQMLHAFVIIAMSAYAVSF